MILMQRLLIMIITPTTTIGNKVTAFLIISGRRVFS
jgi:hypothetical protein